MKRDLELVRKLLFILESNQQSGSAPKDYGLSLWDGLVQYHLRLLVEADLAIGYGYAMNGAVSLRLTWQGHELLELSRDRAIWERAINVVKRETGGSCLNTIRTLLAKWHAERTVQSEPWQPLMNHPVPTDLRRSVRPVAVPLGPTPTSPTVSPAPAPVADRNWSFQLDVLQGEYDEALPAYML